MPAESENSTLLNHPIRLKALIESGLLDSPPEPVFEQLIQLTARIFKAPVALISLVDENRQFFKAQCGLPEPAASNRETPLTHSFCQHVVTSGENLVIEDARAHPLVRENLAVADLGVVAYAGVPLEDADGHVLGSFCVIDTKPRRWTSDNIEILSALADQVMMEIALRSAAKTQSAANEAMIAADEDRRRMARLDRHDLRTPLNAMMLGIEAAILVGEVNEEGKEFLRQAERNGAAIVSMLDKMLDIDNLGYRGAKALSLRRCNPQELVALCVEQVALLAANKGVSLSSPSISTTPFEGDEDKLLRALVNIVANAVKFTDAGGEVGIEVRDCLHEGRESVCFIVTDNGIGIPKDQLQQIFAEGFRVDKRATTRRSTGLGLTFCQRVVQAHGGRIWVESKEGEGSTFSFSIPIESNS